MAHEFDTQFSGINKSDFLSQMGHEIRTPLNAIIGLSALGSQQTDNSLLTQNYFDKINSSVQFLLGVMNDLLNMSKTNQESTVPHEEQICPNDFMESTSSLEKVLSSDIGRLSGKRVLLMEDNETNCLVTERILQQWNMQVVSAPNGQDGVHMFLSHPIHYFDFILMDIRMPVMDGLEAARTIRQLPRKDGKSIPIIALSANAYSEDSQKSLDAGMNVHLAKPVIPQELKRTLLMVAD